MPPIHVHSGAARYPMSPDVGLAALGVGAALAGLLLYDAYRRREEWL